MEADNPLIILGASYKVKPFISGAAVVCKTRKKGGVKSSPQTSDVYPTAVNESNTITRSILLARVVKIDFVYFPDSSASMSLEKGINNVVFDN